MEELPEFLSCVGKGFCACTSPKRQLLSSDIRTGACFIRCATVARPPTIFVFETSCGKTVQLLFIDGFTWMYDVVLNRCFTRSAGLMRNKLSPLPHCLEAFQRPDPTRPAGDFPSHQKRWFPAQNRTRKWHFLYD